MPEPVLYAAPQIQEAHGGVAYKIMGELVPVLEIDMQTSNVYFEHHVLLWKDTHIDIGLKALPGMIKRMLAGLPLLITEASGMGKVAFSRDGAGHVFGIHLHPGQSIDVREHQFLAATHTVDYSFKRVKGVGNMLFGGTGIFIDTFSCPRDTGVLWLHGYGNVFELTLKPGEQIDVEPGGWIFKDASVQMETQFQRFTTGIFGSAGQIFWNRFTGPGRIGIQSMTYYMPTADS